MTKEKEGSKLIHYFKKVVKVQKYGETSSNADMHQHILERILVLKSFKSRSVVEACLLVQIQKRAFVYFKLSGRACRSSGFTTLASG